LIYEDLRRVNSWSSGLPAGNVRLTTRDGDEVSSDSAWRLAPICLLQLLRYRP
jgi:hypothetical protein